MRAVGRVPSGQHARFVPGERDRVADGVGGDYYGYVAMSDGSLGIAIADVSGHGVGAALYMAINVAYIRPYLVGFTAIFAALIGGVALLHFIGGRHRDDESAMYEIVGDRILVTRYGDYGKYQPIQ